MCIQMGIITYVDADKSAGIRSTTFISTLGLARQLFCQWYKSTERFNEKKVQLEILRKEGGINKLKDQKFLMLCNLI